MRLWQFGIIWGRMTGSEKNSTSGTNTAGAAFLFAGGA